MVMKEEGRLHTQASQDLHTSAKWSQGLNNKRSQGLNTRRSTGQSAAGGLPPPVIQSSRNSFRRARSTTDREESALLGSRALGRLVQAVKTRWGTETLSSLYTSREESPERDVEDDDHDSISSAAPAAEVEVRSVAEGMEEKMLNKIVVDRDWGASEPGSFKGGNNNGGAARNNRSADKTGSDNDNTPDKSTTTPPLDGSAVSDMRIATSGLPWWSLTRIIALITHFFHPVTMTDELEARYRLVSALPSSPPSPFPAQISAVYRTF